MTWQRKLALGIVTGVLFLVMAEGIARIIWATLEAKALSRTMVMGEEVLRNDGINFMKQPHGIYGYVLKPGFVRGGTVINVDGFAQRELVPIARRPNALRIVAMGESTTQGHHVDDGNYPAHLKRLLEKQEPKYAVIEMINAGVSGWTSDQIALRAEREMAAYRPDVVILYTGWNDFQSYDPLGVPPSESYFAQSYGRARFLQEGTGLRLITLLSAVYGSVLGKVRATAASKLGHVSSVMMYRYFLDNLDRIVAAFTKANPSVVIAVSTLAGRWPYGSKDEFDATNGHTWWMEQHKIDATAAAAHLARFNDLIREYARTHHVTLIDPAAAFEDLDRSKLFWDFAHLHREGYELLAEVMYEALRKEGRLEGGPSGRQEVLRNKYRAGSSLARAVN